MIVQATESFPGMKSYIEAQYVTGKWKERKPGTTLLGTEGGGCPTGCEGAACSGPSRAEMSTPVFQFLVQALPIDIGLSSTGRSKFT